MKQQSAFEHSDRSRGEFYVRSHLTSFMKEKQIRNGHGGDTLSAAREPRCYDS